MKFDLGTIGKFGLGVFLAATAIGAFGVYQVPAWLLGIATALGAIYIFTSKKKA